MTAQQIKETRSRFSGVDQVLLEARASEVLPRELRLMGYERVLIVCSKTLNTKTDVIRKIEKSLGETVVGTTDEVGEHAPWSNIFAAAKLAKKLNADVLLGVGGGSVIDFCKMVQLCISEDCFEKKEVFQYKNQWTDDGPVSGSKAAPAIRQIIIPTTLATAEWTSGGTPVDEETRLKTLFYVPQSGPELILYDEEVLSQTPPHLLLSTAVRGLDHAINTRCAVVQHPMANTLTEEAIKLFIENMPLLKQNSQDLKVLRNCQLAAWYTGICQQSVMHGFSHFMVHVLGPYANVSHTDAACVLMLAQAKWLEGYTDEPHNAIKAKLGRPKETLHGILLDLLKRLDMSTTLNELGVEPALVEEMIQPALDYELVTTNNVRPIKTAADIRAVMNLAWAD